MGVQCPYLSPVKPFVEICSFSLWSVVDLELYLRRLPAGYVSEVRVYRLYKNKDQWLFSICACSHQFEFRKWSHLSNVRQAADGLIDIIPIAIYSFSSVWYFSDFLNCNFKHNKLVYVFPWKQHFCPRLTLAAHGQKNMIVLVLNGTNGIICPAHILEVNNTFCICLMTLNRKKNQ